MHSDYQCRKEAELREEPREGAATACLSIATWSGKEQREEPNEDNGSCDKNRYPLCPQSRIPDQVLEAACDLIKGRAHADLYVSRCGKKVWANCDLHDKENGARTCIYALRGVANKAWQMESDEMAYHLHEDRKEPQDNLNYV